MTHIMNRQTTTIITRLVLLFLTLSAASSSANAQEPDKDQDRVPQRLSRILRPASEPLINDELLPPGDVLHDRHHQIKLDEAGAFTGKLSMLSADGLPKPVGNALVRIVKDNAVLMTAKSDENGRYSFKGLGEGVVALLATNGDALLMFSVRLVRDESGGVEQNAFETDFASLVISGQNIPIAKQLITSRLPPRDKRFGEPPSKTEENYGYGKGQSSTSVHGHQVQLKADGKLTGQVNVLGSRTGGHREVVDLTLHFIRNGAVVAQTDVEPSGRFSVSGLTAGVHGVVTTGDDGVLALGVEVIGANAFARGDSRFKLASVAQDLELVMAPVNAENFNRDNAGRISNGELPPSASTPTGGGVPGSPSGAAPGGAPAGGGGASGSGGGGLGRGGGLGGLLGAAAVGAIGYAVGQDDKPAATPEE